MQSRSNMNIELNSSSLTAKAQISNSTDKTRNISAKCMLSLADKFDYHRLADKLDHHRNIGTTDVYYKSKRRKFNSGD